MLTRMDNGAGRPRMHDQVKARSRRSYEGRPVVSASRECARGFGEDVPVVEDVKPNVKRERDTARARSRVCRVC